MRTECHTSSRKEPGAETQVLDPSTQPRSHQSSGTSAPWNSGLEASWVPEPGAHWNSRALVLQSPNLPALGPWKPAFVQQIWGGILDPCLP